MKEVESEGLRIKDLRRQTNRSSLDTWEILSVPTGRGKRPFRTLVLEGDVDTAVQHAKFVSETKNHMDLTRARLLTVSYDEAKKWGLVAGVSVIESS
jgi:hypothetical protein